MALLSSIIHSTILDLSHCKVGGCRDEWEGRYKGGQFHGGWQEGEKVGPSVNGCERIGTGV